MSDKPAVDASVIGKTKEKVHTKVEKEQSKAAEQFSHVKDGQQASMRVKVHSPFHEYFEGAAFSLSAQSATGPFDILPHHHNFISLLLPGEMIIRAVNEGDVKVRISGGIIHVKADQIVVFLDV